MPAGERDIDELRRQSPHRLPDDYLAFLRRSNGGEGELPVQPWWFVIWPAEDVVELNRQYEVFVNIPGFLAFGTSGGGELLAFDARNGEAGRVVAIPCIPMDAVEALEVATSFGQFERMMGVTEGERSDTPRTTGD